MIGPLVFNVAKPTSEHMHAVSSIYSEKRVYYGHLCLGTIKTQKTSLCTHNGSRDGQLITFIFNPLQFWLQTYKKKRLSRFLGCFPSGNNALLSCCVINQALPALQNVQNRFKSFQYFVAVLNDIVDIFWSDPFSIYYFIYAIFAFSYICMFVHV